MKKNSQTTPSDQQIKLIRKSNELVEARYRFDIWETRVFAQMLTLIRKNDKDFQLYDIYIGDLLRDFNLQDGGDNYAAVKSAAKKLLSRVIEIEKHTPEGVMWYAMPLLVGATGFKEPKAKDGHYIRVQFHQELRPYLLELKERYLQYDIRNLWGLSSVYSVRMYELLKQYETIGKRRFDLEDLRSRLAIAPTEYKQYGHFKDKIIKKAQEDLRANTDIRFEFEEHKQSRSVSALTFRITANDEAPRGLSVSKAEKAAKAAKFAGEKAAFDPKMLPQEPIEWGVSVEKLANLTAEKGDEAIQNAIDCTLDALRKGGEGVENPGGFFVRALENGWRSVAQARTALAEAAKKEAEKRRAEAERALETAYEALELLENERRGAANTVIRDLANDDPFLAMEAVKVILASQPLCRSLAKQTGLKVDSTLGMDEWRQNKPLRDAVVVQIELLRSADFGEVKAAFDQKIRVVRERVDELRKELGLKKG